MTAVVCLECERIRRGAASSCGAQACGSCLSVWFVECGGIGCACDRDRGVLEAVKVKRPTTRSVRHGRG